MKKRCICLFSGGLDSVLAVKVMQEQGVECVPINFKSPFFCAKKTEDSSVYCLDIPIETVDISDKFMEVLRNPAHGYGSVKNPCVDCKILIMQTAKSLLDKYDASFIVSGEVLGQRPMSQQRQSMDLIAKCADVVDILVRPLSAKLLEPTLPERENVIDRSKLLAISGRGRKGQLALAKKYNIEKFEQPAGGCILTEPQFAPRINDYLSHYQVEDYNAIRQLKIGRHYRIGSSKVVVGRNDYENKLLVKLIHSTDIILMPTSVMGPTAIIHDENVPSDETVRLVAQIVMSYSDCESDTCGITVDRQGQCSVLNVNRTDREQFSQYMLNHR